MMQPPFDIMRVFVVVDLVPSLHDDTTLAIYCAITN